ncbi:MAG: MMPL family transporter [Alphaproteobacteria bacterium]|nr:MMPL family transporter [Alphaproteobacteria bacterium]
MKISAPFIARPIATTLMTAAIVMAGLLGYRALPVSSLPEVDFPTIQVSTRLPGADPETIAALVTAPLERQLGQISGVTTMTSTSSYGTSAIALQFVLGRSIDEAAQDVQAAINVAAGFLPRTLPYPPTYAKVNPADPPILSLALISDTLPIVRISDAADSVLAQKLSQIAGVGRVSVQGDQKPAVRIQIAPDRLASYGLGLEDIRAVLQRANTKQSKGSFDGPAQAFTITANDQITEPDQYRDVIIAYRKGAPVRLRDVAEVVSGLENSKVSASVDGRPAVLIEIQRQPGANVVETADRIKRAIPDLERAIPPGIRIAIVADRTITIRASVADVQFSLGLATVLVVFVIYLFLRSWRATAIPAIALPVSLIATFGVMRLLGFGLDNLSLMALTVATGFVVDDAIVMIENIVRHIEKGESPLAAAYKGAEQIGFTIIGLTVSLVAVFIPLLFMSGVVGRLFHEFAVTLSTAVIISAFVSLTLTPMMCARILRHSVDDQPGPVSRILEGAFDATLRFYMSTLDVVMRWQGTTLAIAGATLVLTIAMYIGIPKGFLPPQDTGVIVATIDAEQDASFLRVSELQKQAVEIARADDAVARVTGFSGAGTQAGTGNTIRLTIVLRPRRERNVTAFEVVRRLHESFAVLPAQTYLQPVQDIQIGARASRTLYQYTLTGPDGVELARWAPQLVEALRRRPSLADIASDQQTGAREIRLSIDRDAASRLGVSLQSIDDTLYDAFGQRQVSTIYAQTNQYRVVMELTPELQSDPDTIGTLRVPGAGGVQVPIGALARIERGPAVLAVNRQSQFPAVTISFDLAQGGSLDQALREIGAAEADLGMPASITGAFAGDAAEFESSLATQPWLILAAIVVIYIGLGVLYESLVHPVTILSTLPSAGIGALLALSASGHDLSLVGLIGIVLLMGIVKKNAIMMIDFAIEAERGEGKSPEEAIREACRLRYRPIMMTTMAALLGALPLALESGTGSELRNPLGISIVGGLVLSQMLTLYTTPVIYLFFERVRLRLAGARPASAR